MLEQSIIAFGRPMVLRCDGRCDKAFGINGRPRRMLSDDPDDYVYLADSEVGVAPPPGQTIGLSEGGHLKPSATPLVDASRMNKWCFRECERSVSDGPLPDFERSRQNIPAPTSTEPKE